MNIREAIATVAEGRSLAEEDMVAVMGQIMRGEATPAQIGAFLMGLRMKGEEEEEIAGAAKALRKTLLPVRVAATTVVDTCGTGGDRCHTFNISTAAAVVVAAAGLTVAKHGNRAISGAVGGADVLEALGVKIDLSPSQVEACIARVGIGFMFAPLFHRAMHHVLGPRREMGVRTLFNLLGPLINPAGPCYQLVGVFAGRWTETLARVLGQLGSRHAMVVHGQDGLDEISPCTPTLIAELQDGEVHTYTVVPEHFGLRRSSLEEIRVANIQEAARVFRAVLRGKSGAGRDAVVLNAGAAIYVGRGAESLADGVAKAASVIDSGAAEEKLRQFAEFTQRQQGPPSL